MKRPLRLIIALVAMLLVGVQGYAQPRHHHHPRHYYYYPYYYRPYYYPSYVWYPSYGYYYYSPFDLYLYGSTSQPTKIRIKDIEFKRTSSGRLRIKIGKSIQYLDLFKYNKIAFSNGEVLIVIETGSGEATITVTEAGNNKVIAVYTL